MARNNHIYLYSFTNGIACLCAPLGCSLLVAYWAVAVVVLVVGDDEVRVLHDKNNEIAEIGEQ